MRRRVLLGAAAGILWMVGGGAAYAAVPHAWILDQQLDANGRGYTVMCLWGTDYEMGYAQGQLFDDEIVTAIAEGKAYLGTFYYAIARGLIAGTVWMPVGVEDELDGMVDGIAVTYPDEGIDKIDLKLMNTAGDWAYACRSHSCWGRYVADPIKTISTRRLDFTTVIPSMNHHVLCARSPDGGAPRWVNMAWPGIVTAATGVNEFGTIVSLHDYNSDVDFTSGRMPRMVACRHALTYATDPDVATHVDDVYSELQNYELMTGSFFNYYAPEGYGGVIAGHPDQAGPDFYDLRKPQSVWHHGEAIITTNTWTDGTYTPADENFGADAYYNDETPKTQESHWNLLAQGANSMHQLSVAYRARGNMSVWADGRIDGVGRTPRIEVEWPVLFMNGDMNCDGVSDVFDIDGFIMAILSPAQYEIAFPDCDPRRADCDGDGVLDVFDIDAFVGLIVD
ncbi:MAG: hypothetical protein JXO22_14455 [Phycisphaerae bacterium]|nr:hypothetical protein [Phycisphaerae bacterium]